jgi:sugar phosphate isomerase/epimerase
MRSVIETGARFLLDPREKHEPTLLSPSRQRRIDFTKYAIDLAADLGSDCVSLWSGRLGTNETYGTNRTYKSHKSDSSHKSQSNDEQLTREQAMDRLGTGPFFGEKTPSANKGLAENMDLSPSEQLSREQAMDRLVEGLSEVLAYASEKNVAIGFEPEPGMLIDTMRAFEELLARIDDTNLCLTLDVGHLHCQNETPIEDAIRRWAPRLVNVHLEDMCRGQHEHLMFGEGEIDFPPILRALAQFGYAGGVYVELSRHSHEGPTAARQALEFLTKKMRDEE